MEVQQQKLLTAFENKEASAHEQTNEERPAFQKKYINLDYLSQLTRNNSGMMAEMIEVYLDETPQLIDTIKKSMENNDWESLIMAAHSVRPSFVMMGISKEFDSIKRIQEYATLLRNREASKETVDALKELFLKVEAVSVRANNELQTELAALKLN